MRGHVFRVAIDNLEPKPYAVVSNNTRNRQLNSVLAVRITTSDKSHIPTAVELTHDDPQVGYALADAIVELFDDEIASATYMGALSPKSLMNLNRALMLALGIPG
jgi:mRNA interferase MazF